jgi:hypothetical protein
MTGEQIVKNWLADLSETWPSFTALGDLVRRIDEGLRCPAGDVADLVLTVPSHRIEPSLRRAPTRTPVLLDNPSMNLRCTTETVAKDKPAKTKASSKTCTWPGCTEPMLFPRLQLCNIHYNRKRDGRDMNAPIKHRAFKGRTETTPRAPKAKPAKASAGKADDGKKHDHPRPIGRSQLGDEASNHRRMDCSAYQRCSLIARRESWLGFTCEQCEGPKA